jgi:small subunit ribosomal protein SAe
VADPVTDHQPIAESSYVNIPVIAVCDSDSPLRFVDVGMPCVNCYFQFILAIPANNKGIKQIGIIFWFLAREILRVRGTLPHNKPWDVMPGCLFGSYFW